LGYGSTVSQGEVVVMKETSKELLLAEYNRLATLEQNRIEMYQHSQQFYLTVITAAAGLVLFLLGSSLTASTLQSSVVLVLGTVLLLGEVTYFRLIRVDVELLGFSKRLQLIRDEFINEDTGLVDAFPEILVQSTDYFRSWSSIRGIIGRALSVSGAKTTVVLLNCIASVAIVIIIVWPRTFWLGLAVGAGIATLVASLHTIHASWRYKIASKQLSKGVIFWWM
jgi:hypothetical protein